MKQLQNLDSLGPRIRSVLEYVFDHPNATNREIAKVFGISDSRVSRIVKHPKFQAAFPAKARERFKAAIPKLTGRYIELGLQSENLGVAEKAAARVLDSQKVLENQAPTTQINVFQGMSTSELRSKLEQISVSPDSVVDTTIVPPDSSTSPT